MANKTTHLSGVMVVDKPSGWTSHDVVSRMRKLFDTRQIGHTGTLDPLATGVLPILVGRAVKACEYLTAHDKCYEATFILGKVSDTGDTDGSVNDTGKPLPSEAEVLAAVNSIIGEQMQMPPMTSAIKVNGKKLIDYARAGESVTVEARPINIYSAEAKKLSECEYSLSLSVSKGTYVRTVITDLGEKLGCGAVMSSLRRTKSGNFDLTCSHTLDELSDLSYDERAALLCPLEDAFSDLEAVKLASFYARLSKNGCEIYQKKIGTHFENGKLLRIYDNDGFYAVGEVRDFPDGSAIKIVKLFSLN